MPWLDAEQMEERCSSTRIAVQVSTFLSELESAAGVAAEGGPNSGPAVAKLPARGGGHPRSSRPLQHGAQRPAGARCVPSNIAERPVSPLSEQLAVQSESRDHCAHGLWPHGRGAAQESLAFRAGALLVPTSRGLYPLRSRSMALHQLLCPRSQMVRAVSSTS